MKTNEVRVFVDSIYATIFALVFVCIGYFRWFLLDVLQTTNMSQEYAQSSEHAALVAVSLYAGAFILLTACRACRGSNFAYISAAGVAAVVTSVPALAVAHGRISEQLFPSLVMGTLGMRVSLTIVGSLLAVYVLNRKEKQHGTR